MKTFVSSSPQETKKIGAKLAKRAGNASRNASRALIFALAGDLGAGKTTFVRGFLKGLGARGRVASPTFIIMRRHPVPRSRRGRQREGRANAFHIDAYRLKKPSDLKALGFNDLAADPQNIIVIEWADKIKRLLPKRVTWVSFRYGKEPHERRISVQPGL